MSFAGIRTTPRADGAAAIDSLYSFTEIAVALAGFAAIALVLGRREGVLPAGSAYVVQFMVINALGPAVIALLAAVLLEVGLGEAEATRLCSAVYLVLAAFFAVLSRRREVVLAQRGDLVLPRSIGVGLWTGSFVAHGIQLANCVGFPADPSVGVFLLGLWVLLSMAAAQFVALLFLTFR